MASKGISAKKQQELQTTYSNYKNTLQQLAQKIGDVEQEAEEHKFVRLFSTLSSFLTSRNHFRELPGMARHGNPLVWPQPYQGFSPLALVLDTLEPLPGDRKCFRMINGVLVERTVQDVIPALRTNAEGLKKVLDDLVKQYKIKQDDLEKWKKKNNIQVVQS
ncbi:Prefoldin subunit-domain-containing protein [Daldinia vernicosa]|uniref:Prefoldin subunit-domain-containing protein n=1 Tax=Daldinia vernicosa TaxID=114800 RepID=UPI00200724BB|nr:Prefoldin subunit-domain-containing protein [Daldinia vernicosa]KAI0852672.1 Prefoldin subunit-domain-containing protein [Daldinia vernicosa]